MSSPEYDYVVVGGGAAGSVLAARLSEDPTRSVLLLEAGPDLRPDSTPPGLRSINPFRAMREPYTDVYSWSGLTARRAAGQTPAPYLRGRGLGGSSAINGQIALHALPEDFDDWRDLGCTGWGAADVASARTRLENDLDFGNRDYHGTGGPMPISRAPLDEWGATGIALRDAAIALGYGWTEDVNDPTATGVSPLAHTCRDGLRVSTSDAYLEPARARENLTILCETVVDRILVGADGRARGVADLDGETVAFGREIILAAGATATPGILVRSGIGPAATLAELGIEVLVDLPVGATLRDHAGAGLTISLAPTARANLDGRAMSCCLRYSSRLAGAGRNDMMMIALNFPGADEADRDYGYVLVAAFQTFSTGSLRTVSRDPLAHPEIDMNLLSDERDLVRLRDGVRRLAMLVRQPAFERIASTVTPVTHTVFRDTETGDFTLSQLDDDRALDAWIRDSVNDTAHLVGTCPMGPPGDPRRVVDPDCRVLGVAGLRVVDASVMPTVPRANTLLPTVVVAERMAERIVAESGSERAGEATRAPA